MGSVAKDVLHVNFPKAVPKRIFADWELPLRHSFNAFRWDTTLAMKLRTRKL